MKGHYHIEGISEGIADIRGIDLGPGPYTVAAHKYNGETRYLAVRVKGHSAWGGLGQDREYVPAQIHVFLWYDDNSADFVMSIPVKEGAKT